MNEKHMQDMKNHDNDVKSGKAKEIFKVMKKEKKRCWRNFKAIGKNWGRVFFWLYSEQVMRFVRITAIRC